MEKLNTPPNEVQDQIINFQKQYIWKEKRHDYLSMWLEIEKLEQDVEKFNRNIIEKDNSIHRILLWSTNQNEKSFKHDGFGANFRKKTLGPAKLDNFTKSMMDNLNPKENEETESQAIIKFQRTMRRLAVLRRFAKRLGLEFDIENMEISLLTKQKSDQESNDKKENQGVSEIDIE